MADRETDQLYGTLRSRWGADARANGYQLDTFFRSEQNLVLSALTDLLPIVDVACGSGLMILPARDTHPEVFGLDYNQDACTAAASNDLPVTRGDAFNLPFGDATIGQIVNCQFLNQQDNFNTERFLAETGRVLKPGGRLVITWRHARSLLHRTATLWLKARQDPAAAFPQYVHPASQIAETAEANGLKILKLEVTWPFKTQTNMAPDTFLSGFVGASLFMVAERVVEKTP